MEKYNQNIQANSANSTEPTSEEKQLENEKVLDMTSAQAKKSNESSAFSEVMSQMNIADINTFDMHYKQLWQEASENKEMLSILICEIDYYKEYNDHYGHQAAAFMLLVVALELKKQCEEYGGFLARYKADKFAVLIKAGEITKVEQIAKSLRKSIEQKKTEHAVSKVDKVVTLSVGTSNVYPTSMKMLIDEADTALCISQESGNKQTNLSLIVEKTGPAFDTAIVSPLPQAPLNIRTHTTPVQKSLQSSVSSMDIESKKEKLNDQIGIVPSHNEAPPAPNNRETQQETKSKEKVDLLDRFKSMIPSSKSAPQQELKTDEHSEIPSLEKDNASFSDKTELQQQEESNYDQLKAELERLKRKSEGGTPPAPIRYY